MPYGFIIISLLLCERWSGGNAANGWTSSPLGAPRCGAGGGYHSKASFVVVVVDHRQV